MQEIQETNLDFRSDVVSVPPQEMRKFMRAAQIGDDTFFDDPTADIFQAKIAEYFGKQAALIVPTATMGNLISTKLWTKPGDQVIIWAHSHTIDREGGGIALIGGVQTLQISGDTGIFSLKLIQQKIKKQHVWCMVPPTKLIFIENGTFGGDVWPLQQLKKIKQFAEKNGIKIHIDGARILNAIAHYGCSAKQIGQCFDSMVVCLSKGLCCPVGAVLLGSKADMLRARTIRKGLGGGMKQIGFIAASGIYALDNMVPQIKRDNQMAKYIAQKLQNIQQINIDMQRLKINMIHFKFKNNQTFDHEGFFQFLKTNKIIIKSVNKNTGEYRLCTHRTLRQRECDILIAKIKEFLNK